MPSQPDTLSPVSFIGGSGIRLVADIGGPPNAQPVMLMHGGGQTRYSWKRTARELVGLGYHVISLDLRGHGESEWAGDEDYSLDAFVLDCCTIAASLINPPVLIGASLGGIIAMLAAGGTDGIAAKALILVDIAVSVDNSGSSRVRSFMTKNREGFASLEQVVAAVQSYNPHRAVPPNPQGLMKNLRRGEDDRLYWHWDPALLFGENGPDAANAEHKAKIAAKNIDVSMMVLRGEHSDVLSKNAAEEFQRMVPAAEIVTICSVGHMIVGDNNDDFRAAIEEFLIRNAPP